MPKFYDQKWVPVRETWQKLDESQMLDHQQLSAIKSRTQRMAEIESLTNERKSALSSHRSDFDAKGNKSSPLIGVGEVSSVDGPGKDLAPTETQHTFGDQAKENDALVRDKNIHFACLFSNLTIHPPAQVNFKNFDSISGYLEQKICDLVMSVACSWWISMFFAPLLFVAAFVHSMLFTAFSRVVNFFRLSHRQSALIAPSEQHQMTISSTANVTGAKYLRLSVIRLAAMLREGSVTSQELVEVRGMPDEFASIAP